MLNYLNLNNCLALVLVDFGNFYRVKLRTLKGHEDSLMFPHV